MTDLASRNSCPACKEPLSSREIAREGMMHGRSHRDGGPFYTLLCPKCRERIVAEFLTVGEYALTREIDLPKRSRIWKKMRRFLGMPATRSSSGSRILGFLRRPRRVDAGEESPRFGPAPTDRPHRFASQFRVLGLDRDASLADVKRRYRELAKQHHPDRFSRASEHVREEARKKFVEIRRAYKEVVDRWPR